MTRAQVHDHVIAFKNHFGFKRQVLIIGLYDRGHF